VNAILNYLVHLALAALLLVVFFKAYTWMTPYDEVKLIRQGNHAAALSLGGAMLGFSMTIASSILHTNNWQQFLAWALGAMVVQALGYAVTTRCLKMAQDQIEADNSAFGGLLGTISLSIGGINAACIS
jgi:putative membrane protein